MKIFKQFTLEDRIKLEQLLNGIKITKYETKTYTLSEISTLFNVNRSTILREILRNRTFKLEFRSITLNKDKNRDINDISNHSCEYLREGKYKVCNQCIKRKVCVKDPKVLYIAKTADELAKKRLINSRIDKGNTKLNNSKLKKEVQRGLDFNQSKYHISVSLDNEISTSTIYRGIKKGIFKSSIKQLKKNKVKKEKVEYVSRQLLVKDKEYVDFIEYKRENPRQFVCEVDIVEGSKRCSSSILTLFIEKLQFFLAFKLEESTKYEVRKVFDYLETTLGTNLYKTLFGLILTDRGVQFLNENITLSIDGKTRRGKIFYCDPGTPTQKPNVENVHRIFRDYVPKGCNVDLIKQEHLNFVVSNMNNMVKKSYFDKTPVELFLERFRVSTLNKLNVLVINKKDVRKFNIFIEYNLK